jgi:hypothetical protein
MATLLNTFEGGTNGSGGTGNMTNTNSGGVNGDVFALNPNNTTGLVFSATTPQAGSLCARLNAVSGTSTYFQWTLTAHATQAVQFYILFESAVTVNAPFLVMRGAGTTQLTLQFNTSSQFVVLGATGGSQFTSAALSLNVWYRIDMWMTRATSTTGTLHFDYFVGNSTTPVEIGLGGGAGPLGAGKTNVDLGVNDFDQVRFGAPATTTGTRTWRIDNTRAASAQASYFLPFGTNIPPTVDAGPNQTKASGQTATMSPTASDSDGTITGYAWTMTYSSTAVAPTMTGANTAGMSFPVGTTPGQLWILSLTVTDNSGGTATDTMEVRFPTTGDAFPLPGNGTGASGFTIIGGSATQGAALADASSTTRVESPDLTASFVEHQWRMAPMSTRSALAVLFDDVVLTASSTDSTEGRIYCGATLIASLALALTTADQDKTLTLTSGQVSAITDWGEVYGAIAVKS